MTTERPGLYPYHDVTGTNITYPEDSDFLFTGYVAGVTPVPSADHNGKLNRAGFWFEYLDRNGITNEDWLDTSVAAQLTLTSLTYNAGGNVLTTGAVVNARGTYLVNATRVETDAPFLNPVDGSVLGDPLVYPGAVVPGRIWVYAGANGQVRYDSVAPATADAPGVNEISLIGLDVDALGVVTNGAVVPVTLPLPAWRLPVVAPLYLDGNDTMLSVVAGDAPGGNPAVFFDGQSGTALSVQANSVDPVAVFKQNGAGTAVTVQGDLYTTANLVVDGTTVITGTTTCNGDVNLGNASGDTIIVAGTTTFNANATFNANVTLGNADTDVVIINGGATFTNDVTIGNDATDVVAIGGTATVTAPMTFEDDLIIDGGAGGSLSTDPTAVVQINGHLQATGRVTIDAGASVAAGDLSNDGSNNLRWRDASTTKFVQYNVGTGWVRGYGLDTTEGPAASINVQTASQVAPLTASDLTVEGKAYLQRAVAGKVTISLIAVGDGQIGTSFDINIPLTAGDDWYPVFLTRTYSANTTARHYQFSIDGTGQNVTGKNMTIEVVPAA